MSTSKRILFRKTSIHWIQEFFFFFKNDFKIVSEKRKDHENI